MIGGARYRLYFDGAPGGSTHRLSQTQTDTSKLKLNENESLSALLDRDVDDEYSAYLNDLNLH